MAPLDLNPLKTLALTAVVGARRLSYVVVDIAVDTVADTVVASVEDNVQSQQAEDGIKFTLVLTFSYNVSHNLSNFTDTLKKRELCTDQRIICNYK